MDGKIALEEHFVSPDRVDKVPPFIDPESLHQVRRRLPDFTDVRLRDMDDNGIERAVLSLNAPGVQGETDLQSAIDLARRTNDELASAVARNPDRFSGFAAVPLQDPDAAAAELHRCVSELGFVGAMAHGYTDGYQGRSVYLDEPQFTVFWQAAEELRAPVYLHPRDPLPDQQAIYDGHPELLGAVWAFTVETATHALRLITSGLFDRCPDLTVILGHLGEGLPHLCWRVEHRLRHGSRGKTWQRSLSSYLNENFYITTSGNFRTQALINMILEMGADRIMFSVDYPWEGMDEAAEWFDAVPISDADKLKIGRTNAQRLLFGKG